MKKYVLESKDEFDRLEKQSKVPAYSPESDFRDLKPKAGAQILDAGCGSGIASRYLANAHPSCEITAVDRSTDRIKEALSRTKIRNVSFLEGDLTQLNLPGGKFDFVFCRYVLEHLSPTDQGKAVENLVRCAKPGAEIRLIDIDGLIYNIYPQPKLVRKTVERMMKAGAVDLQMGRKLPNLLAQAGLNSVNYEVQTVFFGTGTMEEEISQLEGKFENAREYFASFLDKGETVDQLKAEYFSTLRKSGSVLFYNKFIATAVKPLGLSLIKKR